MHYRELGTYLQAPSKKCLKRRRTQSGKPYYYRPRVDLLKRLSEVTGEDIEEVQNMLYQLRDFYLKNSSEAEE